MGRVRASFWIGFSAAVGAILSVAVVAAARGGASTPGRTLPSFSPHATRVVVSNRPLAETLAVFSRMRRTADVLPPSAVAAFGALGDQDQVAAALRPGTPDAGRSRLLLADVGTWHGAFYAAPTSDGNVCYVVTGGPASCATGFTQHFPVGAAIFDRDGFDGGAPAAITGLVPDEVAGVTVVVNGARHAARVANNAYFYQLPADVRGSPESLLIGYRDGTTLTMPLPSLRSPGSR